MARDGRLSAGRIHYPAGSDQEVVRRRLVFAGLAVIVVVLAGIFGYWLLGGGVWSLVDCAYMVVITITSVGYAEVLPVSELAGGRAFTMVLLITGMGVSFYFLSALTAFIIEGDLQEAIWRRRMGRSLDKLEGHYIVCGAGETGKHVVEELVQAGLEVVVIEQSPEHLDALFRLLGTRFIGMSGDATEDSLLLECGIERAAGIVTSLQSDRDNLFITVTARQLNPRMRIVSRAVHEQARPKLLRAGADAIVSPNTIGGRRMAHELLRPSVVGFLDLLVRDAGHQLSVEECLLRPGTRVEGRTLAGSGIRKVSNVLVLSVITAARESHVFNPSPDFVLRAGMTLIVLGDREDVERLKAWLDSTSTPHVDLGMEPLVES
ncbi:MAG: potassium channel protein [Myxococcales bacterium]|nr:potassium channel protein [Myxococcales bacterium]MCB9549488.1 potassium channel protein [Myxococcales bacterium]